MSSGPISYANLTSGVSAFVTAFQDLLQQKYDKRGTSLSAGDSSANAVAQWANLIDDQLLALVSAIEDGVLGDTALPPIAGQTTDATPSVLETVSTLSTNGDTYLVSGDIVGIGDTDAKRVIVKVAGTYYRSAGVVAVLAPTILLEQSGGLAVASVALGINCDEVESQSTGDAGETRG